ncbi:MAG: hypothetical protein L6R48_16175 [Planctomycetes bacterium]|nr:hypothetical protein [Planctomycetota bacterium]
MLDHLGDHAPVRVTAIAPAARDHSLLIPPLAKLFAQFVREGRCRGHGAALACDGHALVLAWEGGALSGCAGDRLARLLAWCGRRQGIDLLTAPPLVVESTRGWIACTRAGLRALAAAGEVLPGSRVADTRVTTLGAWRRQGLRPLESTWVQALLPSLHAATP